MTETTLPELAADAAPEFIDAASCKEWLENLPLAEAEATTFTQTVALWNAMRLGYLRCLDAARSGETGMSASAATVCQRVLAYTGLSMFHHYRAYREIPGEIWRALHAAYMAAEELGIAEEAVKDYLNRDVNDTSPRIAYVRAAILGLCNPHEISQRQLTFVAFLLERWGDKIDIGATVAEDPEVPPLTLDMQGETGPQRYDPARHPPGPGRRFLDAGRLGKSLRNRIALLRKGESPAKLALGEDCVQPSCEQMLVYLYRHWCQAPVQRAADRRPAKSAVAVTGEIAGIHYQLTGAAFRQPASNAELTAKQREEIATFGRISTRDEDTYAASRGFALEDWHLQDESLQGLKMLRASSTTGRRYVLGQLIAARPADARTFMLGQVRWLMTGTEGDLHAALRLMPGLPAAIAVKPTGLNASNEKFVPALSLTAVAALNSPPSLVLPSGWYKPKRVIEVHIQQTLRAQLTELLERGSDFERVAYQVLPD